MKFIQSLLAAAAAAAALAVPMAAQATPSIEILIDGTAVALDGALTVCADGAACDGAGATAGALSVQYSNSFLTFTISTGLTKPIVAFPELMDLAVSGFVLNTASGATAHTVEVRFSETGFSQGGLAIGTYTNNNFATAATATAYFGTSLFDTTNTIGSTSPAAGGGKGSFQGVIDSTPYSLTTGLLFTIGAGESGLLSSDFRMHIPEPGTVALVSLALLGTGLASRRRRG